MENFSDMELVSLARGKFVEDSEKQKLYQRLSDESFRADFEVIIDEALQRKTIIIDTCKICDIETRDITKCLGRKQAFEIFNLAFSDKLSRNLTRKTPICLWCVGRIVVETDPMRALKIIQRINIKREELMQGSVSPDAFSP
uniref:Protein 4 n=1 Tax=Brassica virus 2_Ole TaxID=2977960 RepID=A0A9N7AB25_9RHAB|nr:TPA_asm: protein 4 [Brassica virus 2_Ole]